jgi:hypothetical protein
LIGQKPVRRWHELEGAAVKIVSENDNEIRPHGGRYRGAGFAGPESMRPRNKKQHRQES